VLSRALLTLKRPIGFGSWLWGWIPITGLGWFLLLLTGPTLAYLALASQDLVLQALCSGYLFLQVGLSLWVLLRAWILVWHLRRPHSALPHGAEAERGYRLPAPAPLWNWFPFVQVEWTWSDPAADVQVVRGDGLDQEEVVLARRGVYSQVVREFRVSDLLGLARVRFRRIQNGEFQVIPALGRLQQQPLLVQWTGGDEISDPRGDPSGDRVDIRQYTRGDSPRTILWKVFARSRRLMVRVPERSHSPRPKVCSYLITGPRDEAAAALCRVLLEGEMLGPEWRFGCDGLKGQDQHKSSAMERLCRSAQSRQPQPDQLLAYLQQAQQDGYSQGIVVLPVDLAGREQAVRDALLRSPVPLQLCLAVDGQPQASGSGRGLPRLFYSLRQPGSAQRLDLQLRKIAELFRGYPGPIRLVDRRSGALLGDLQAYARRRA